MAKLMERILKSRGYDFWAVTTITVSPIAKDEDDWKSIRDLRDAIQNHYDSKVNEKIARKKMRVLDKKVSALKSAMYRVQSEIRGIRDTTAYPKSYKVMNDMILALEMNIDILDNTMSPMDY